LGIILIATREFIHEHHTTQFSSGGPGHANRRSLAHFEALAAPARGQIKITAIKAIQTADTGTIIRIETDAGLVGYGPATGPARSPERSSRK